MHDMWFYSLVREWMLLGRGVVVVEEPLLAWFLFIVLLLLLGELVSILSYRFEARVRCCHTKLRAYRVFCSD